MFRERRGFTLIELLVVIAILGILASIVISNITSIRAKARDTHRIADMRTIQHALAFYFDDYGTYPGTPGTALDPQLANYPAQYGGNESDHGALSCSGWDSSAEDTNGNGIKFLDPLKLANYLPSTPVDPINDIYYSGGGSGNCTLQSHIYRYSHWAAGEWSCDPARGSYYVLSVHLFETGGNSTAERRATWHDPRFAKCDASTPFQGDWVAGEFSK